MTNRNLEIFVAVAEYGKMSRAARELFITQSSVSQAISEIEKEYGVLLFERLSRSLYLTDVGKGFLEYAKKALSIQSEMENFLNSTSNFKRLRIGATITIGSCLIGPIAKELSKRVPGIRSEVTVANTHIVEDLILKTQLDIGLVEGTIKNPDLKTYNAIADEMVLICNPSHRFSKRDSISVKELEGEPFILRELGSGTRSHVDQILRQNRVSVDPIWNCSNSEAIVNGVISGHGISLLSKRLVTPLINEGKLCACNITDADFSRTFSIVHHKDKLINDAVRAFIEICCSMGHTAPPSYITH